LRWCLFAEPLNLYRGKPVRLEAVLANEDALAPGEYPVRLQVVGPDLARVFDKRITVKIADPTGKPEPPMVVPVFSEEVVIAGPPGAYRFLATFERGAAACGEETRFFVDVPSSQMPAVEGEVVLIGADGELARWLGSHEIKCRPYEVGKPQTEREVIVLSGKVGGDPAPVFADLVRRIARGSTAIFLTTDTYARGSDSTGWLPLKTKGRVSPIARWLYHSDEWARRHPIFEGLQAGGLLDYSAYRDMIPELVFMDIQPATEPIAGAINASWGYQSGLILGSYEFGAGRFILNSLRIRENLGQVPQAERLIRNMLRFASSSRSKPPADLPADFAMRLKAVGY
jgi:hypothetical protein